MSFDKKIMLIYSIIFVIIGLFIWLYIKRRNQKDRNDMDKDIDYSDTNDDNEEGTLADYENVDEHVILPTRSGGSTTYDSLDDFINNFYRADRQYDDYDDEDVEEDNLDYTMTITPIKNPQSEVVNVLIGTKTYIFLANGNKLENGDKIILKIDDKNYNGTIVKSNYERDLSNLSQKPKPLEVIKIID